MSSIYATVPKAAGVEARLAKAKPYMGIPQSNLTLLLPLVAVVCLVVPWGVFVLPVCAIYVLLVVAPMQLKAYFATVDVSADKSVASIKPVEKLTPLEDREFDVVVFGVTGHSGFLLAEYLVMQYASKGNLKIALAGRNAKKLAAAREKLAINSHPSALDLPLLFADSSNDASLEDMCMRTKVVGTTVGPFLKYGESLVRACARTGTGYCDLTGETGFAEIAYAKYNKVAVETGARVVSFTGFDSVPADVGTIEVVKKFKAKFGKAPAQVDCVYSKLGGEAAGGTIDTVVHLLENGLPPTIVGKKDQPTKKGEASMTLPFVYYNRYAESWTIPFFMAPVNSKVVEWTNNEIGHSPKLSYNEVMGMPNISSVIIGSLLGMIGGSFFVMKATRDLIFSMGWLPKPGVGPSRAKIAKGYSLATFYASSADGKCVESLRWANIGDPGGFATALYQGECCVALVKDSDRPGPRPTGAGLTVGMCIGADVMLERLNDSGFLNIV
ncbi:hypothetical protein SARC_09913 [Sphaeroforma arctica JP610]|uniref:Uncharacterized protein n=1 Tax=Sphaeroforma arctica JP610 TaxID=667725 RepID=A0A0L0FLH8_9EUKA|nr:hypothetical protein SARC_09913 [Sphaeroforma arctica JP610]KNC77632.1 hypothetical protein SARC_09913 [Sphaeroforma arctica JP610]|eukprot:XP_014151534.1 hypothetical protein SARC_09913 [Sphaeroforma arctica JP610]